MATFIAILDFTQQGIRNLEISPARADAVAAKAKELGITVKAVYWTLGAHDGVLIFDAPDDKLASALVLSFAKEGNVHAHTLRAYDRSEFESVLANVD